MIYPSKCHIPRCYRIGCYCTQWLPNPENLPASATCVMCLTACRLCQPAPSLSIQAHLLSISRNMASRHRSPAGSVCARHVTTQSSLRPPAGKSRTVVQDTITNCKRYDVDAVNKVERIDNGRFIGPESNNAAVDTPIPRCRPPLPSSYTNEKGR